jgi:hypothetical protein
MTVPAPSSAPPAQYHPRRNYGCLWGCLIAILIVVVPPLFAASYGTWYLWQGYRRDPVLRLAGELVREDSMAEQMLGYGAVITGIEGNIFSWMPGLASDSYEVELQGPKGPGHLSVSAHHSGLGPPKLDSAILTGPDGERYDLLRHQVLHQPGQGAPDTSI